MPAVSIVMPVYQAEAHLAETLESVAAQTFRDFEVLCVDDGSLDSSGAILDDFAKKDPRFQIFHRKNSGPGASRNFALDQAAGKYVICLDSDDLFEAALLGSLYARAEQDEAEIVVCRYDSFDTISGAKTYELHYPENMPRTGCFSLKTSLDLTFGDFRPEPWKYLFRRDFLNRWSIRFSTVVRNAEDVPFTNSALALTDRISLEDRVLVHYRVGSGSSLESRKTNANMKNFYSSLLEWKKKLLDCGVWNQYEFRFRISAFYVCVYNLRKYFESEDFPSFYADVRDDMFPQLGITPEFEVKCSEPELLEKIRRVRTLSADEYRNAVLNDERELAERKARQAEYAELPAWLRCLKENGLGYTLKHVLKKLTGGEK